MLQHSCLSLWYPVMFVCHAGILIIKHAIQALFFTILGILFTTVNAQESPTQLIVAENKVAKLSESEFLTKAKSLQRTDQQTSIKLANEALIISQDNKNYRVSAQAHYLLGKLEKQSKNIDQSLHHFLQASLLYKNLNDKQNQIRSSIAYADIFFDEKRYDEGDKVIDELLPIVQQHGDELSIALIFMTKGDSYYRQKRYNDAIKQYSHAIKYLSGKEENIQKYLAQIYHQIAQANKHLKNSDQSITFYKNELVMYTALQDQKSIARTLNNLASAERSRGDYLTALDYSIRGLEMHKQFDDPEMFAKSLLGAGRIYRYIGRYEQSIKQIHKAHLYYKKINDFSNTAETSNQMGLIYTRLKQFDQARSFYQLTIDLPEKEIKSETRAAALREIAVIDLNANNFESAIVMAKKAHKIYQDKNDKSKNAMTARIIGNIYRDQKNYTQAITYYRESLSLAKEVDNKNYQTKALNCLGHSLITKDTDEAVELLKKALTLSIQINMRSETLTAYRWLKLAEKSRGNYAAALSYSEKENALSKIVQQEKDKNELVLAKANLHSHKMELELEFLREKTKLDQLELAKKNNEIEIAEQASQISELELTKNKYASIALASLLAICLVAVIFISRRFILSHKRNKELDYLATRDPLTNCYNRRVLFELMNRDFANIELLGEYCIILIDIDHFKAVNDTYGHSAGDSVLCAIANILQDSVSQRDSIARFGGEEFCIVLPDTTQNEAMSVAETIRHKVETSQFDDITVTCSFGVTSTLFNAKTPAELIDQADLALYKSKSLGRNKVTIWEQSLKSHEI